ncbi:MAG: hypothetical protein WD604_08195 [Balneolaceae bacterium]
MSYAFETLNTRKHYITLKDFSLESGKISFNYLQKVAGMLQAVAGGSLRIVIEGISSKKGPKPEWLEKAIDFQLSGIRKGSTDLEIEAPLLRDAMELQQIPLFRRSPESLQHYSGIDIAMEGFSQAFDPEENNDDLLDKHLLGEMRKYRSLFKDTKSSIVISGAVKKGILRIGRQSFEQIKQLEAKTPPSAKARITGVLDLMQYSKDLLQINTGKGVVRALLTSDISFGKISEFFGKKVMVEGLANYKPSGSISAVEVSGIRLATEADRWYETPHSAIREQLDITELRAKQKYEGLSLEKIIGQWPGDESIEELLEMRKK